MFDASDFNCDKIQNIVFFAAKYLEKKENQFESN